MRDPLCLAACLLYAGNRWLVKPHCPWPWVHSWMNDLLLIPAALPLVLGIQRLAGVRRHDVPPRWSEIASHLILWAVLFEWIGPRVVPWATGDAWDVVAYTLGAIGAGCWWNRGVSL